MTICKNLALLFAITLTLLACTPLVDTHPPSLATATTLAQQAHPPTPALGADAFPTVRVVSPTSPLAQTSPAPMLGATPLAGAAPIKSLAKAGDGGASAIAWSLDSKLLIVGGALGVSVYEADALQMVRHIDAGTWVKSVALSPDGHTLAAGPGKSLSDLTQSMVTLWNVDTGQKLRALDAGQAGIVVAFSPDGRTLATVGRDVVRLWNVATGQPVRDFELAWWDIIFSPDLRRVGIWEEKATLWDLETGAPLFVEERSINGAAFSPDSAKMAISVDGRGDPDTIEIFDANTGQLLRTLEGPYASKLAFSSDSRQLAAAGGHVKIWDMDTGQLAHTLDGDGLALALVFSPDGRTLAVASSDLLKLWDIDNGQVLHTFEFQVDWGGGRPPLSFSPDGHRFAALDRSSLRVWNIMSGQLLQTVNNKAVEKSVLTPDDYLFVFRAGETKVWQVDRTAGQLKALSDLSGPSSVNPFDPYLVAISPDGQILALAQDRAIQLLDAKTGRLLHTLEGHPGTVLSLLFSPDGATLASTGELPLRAFSSGPVGNSDIRLWDVKTGNLLSTHETYPWLVFIEAFPSVQIVLTGRHQFDACSRGSQGDVAAYSTSSLLSSQGDASPLWSSAAFPYANSFSQGLYGNVIAAVSQSNHCLRQGPVEVWNVQTGETLLTVSLGKRAATNLPIFVTSLALNPEGTAVAIGGDDGSLGIWNINTGQRSHLLQGLTARATRLLYSLDGQWLVSGNADGALQVWDAASGQLVQTVWEHSGLVNDLLSSSDGRIIVSSSDDGTVRLWDIGSRSPLPPPTPFTSTFHTIVLDSIANADSGFQSPPTGRVSLKEIPFDLSPRIFKSQAAPAPHAAYPTTAQLPVDVSNAYRLHLLLNTGNGFTQFSGKTVGEVAVTCDGVRTVIAQLKLGQDVREWNASSSEVVSTATRARLAWSGAIADAPATGYIDLLSLSLPTVCQQGRLSLIEIADTSDTLGSLDPALNLTGVTVESRQPGQ